MEQIYLIGYRCTGKTATGRELSARLQWAFCEMDRMIADRAGQTIEEIFSTEGEERFRELEQRILKECRSIPEAVVSTGGGVVTRSSNRDLLDDSGPVVWLRASVDTIRERMKTDRANGIERPPLRGDSAIDEVDEVLDERRPLYDEVADFDVSTDDRSPGEAAEKVLDRLR